MKKYIHQRERKSLAIALLPVILLFGMVWMEGCSTVTKERQREPGKTDSSNVSKYHAQYGRFDDVLVPGELKYNQKKSFVYEAPQFKAGSLVYSKWRLDVDPLIDFFAFHMEKDNWKLVNIYRGEESFLSFSKPEKTCTIRIIERWYGSTEVEIRVGPLVAEKTVR